MYSKSTGDVLLFFRTEGQKHAIKKEREFLPWTADGKIRLDSEMTMIVFGICTAEPYLLHL